VRDGEPTPHTLAEGTPVAPSLEPTVAAVHAPSDYAAVDQRVIVISGIAIAVGSAGALIATLLTHLIGFIANLAYFGRLSGDFVGRGSDSRPRHP
jgi:hypothetical protein